MHYLFAKIDGDWHLAGCQHIHSEHGLVALYINAFTYISAICRNIPAQRQGEELLAYYMRVLSTKTFIYKIVEVNSIAEGMNKLGIQKIRE